MSSLRSLMAQPIVVRLWPKPPPFPPLPMSMSMKKHILSLLQSGHPWYPALVAGLLSVALLLKECECGFMLKSMTIYIKQVMWMLLRERLTVLAYLQIAFSSLCLKIDCIICCQGGSEFVQAVIQFRPNLMSALGNSQMSAFLVI